MARGKARRRGSARASDIPAPVTRDDNQRSYAFSGRWKKAALIYSIDEDGPAA